MEAKLQNVQRIGRVNVYQAEKIKVKIEYDKARGE